MRRLSTLVFASLAGIALLGARNTHADSPLHPEIVLLDADGREVLESGAPVSPSATCGACHDTTYIESHSYHAAVGYDETFEPGSREGVPPWNTSPGLFGRWDPMRYRRLTVPGETAFDLGVADWIRVFGDRHVGGGPAYRSRAGGPLETAAPDAAVDPETHARDLATGAIRAWDWDRSGGVEMNCFLCHLAEPADAERRASLRAGAFGWAATATLARVGVVAPNGDGTWRYVREAFQADGTLPRGRLRIRDPHDENCGLCHGVVHERSEPVDLHHALEAWETESKGQVWSPQRVAASALNLEAKETLAFPWDVHAARLVGCTDCHHALNNPAAFLEAERSRPRHLAYDARRLEIGDYLTRPSHHFTKGESAQGTVARRLDDSMRRCEDCHDALDLHAEWLPNAKRHLTTLLCETCHLPEVVAPARETCDWTVLTPARGPRVGYRGVDGPVDDPASLIRGFEPVVLPRHQEDGTIRHGPHNLCTTWYWVAGDPERPVPVEQLEAAYFDAEGGYDRGILLALDEDGDGALSTTELRLDTEAKIAAVRLRLEAAGASSPRVEGLIQPLSLHHGIRSGAFATRACETCHARDSRLTRPFEVSSYVPAGAEARLVGDTNITMPGRVFRGDGGRLLYQPVPTASGRYVIGHDRAGWIDTLGILVVLGTFAGVAVHAGLRWHHGRRRRREVA